MRGRSRGVISVLLALSLFFASLVSTSQGQTGENPKKASEFIRVTVDLIDHGTMTTLPEGLELTFDNATYLPFNYSLEAFNSHFNNARFSVVREGVFLRVSYNATSDVNTAEAYSDEVLGEFQKAFNFSLNVMNETHVSPDNASIDIYYQLSISGNARPFEELVKYCPRDGFGELVNESLLSLYIPGDSSMTGLLLLEYTLTRLDQTTLGWTFDLQFNKGAIYKDESQIDVSLNDLLNHTGPITPSAQRSSRVVIYIGKKEITDKRPLLLSLNTSTPLYTSLKEEGDYNVATYNLTKSVDNIAIKIDIVPEQASSFSFTDAVIIVSIVCIASVVVLVFVRTRRRKRRKAESLENSK